MKSRKPVDVPEGAIERGLLVDMYRRMGPGQVILHLPYEARLILKELKSNEIVDLRPDSSPWLPVGGSENCNK